MEINPKVSVIVPNYNHSAYLGQRLDSIIGQTYQNFELIILDDCSTDSSKIIINQYKKHPRVSNIVYNETNSGSTFKQWEKGIELAVGEYIWIAESDDWCEPNLLETLVNGLLDNAKCVVAYAQSYAINNTNEISWQSSYHLLSDYVEGLKYIKENLVLRNSIFNASMALFKRAHYLRISKRYTGFKFCGDWLFWIEIAKQGDVFISGRLLNYFRQHDGNVTGQVNATGYSFIEELKLLKLLENDTIIDNRQFKGALLAKYFIYFINKNKFTGKMRAEIEHTFFLNGDTSYRNYLNREINISRIKNKLSLFFNRFLK